MDATHGGAAAANNSSNSAENSNDIPHLRHLQVTLNPRLHIVI